MILEEFDSSISAVIDPCDIRKELPDMPKVVVSCFERGTFGRMLDVYGGTIMDECSVANMAIPVYKTVYKGTPLALVLMDCGASCCAALCEDLYCMGAQMLVLFGSCGVLDSTLSDCAVMIPDAAVRDEGTSYHYLPSSDEIKVNERHIPAFTRLLDDASVKYAVGKVWTTDAVYRETRAKVQKRREQGCICVDMECSAAAAVARFRNKDIFHFFFVADVLGQDSWDPGCISNSANFSGKDKAAWLAMEFALSVSRNYGN